MVLRRRQTGVSVGLLAAMFLLVLCLAIIPVQPAHAAASVVRTANGSTNNVGGTSASATMTGNPAAGDLLIIICGVGGSNTFKAITGFTAIRNDSGTASQAMFYKIATGSGEASATCSLTTATTSPIVVGYLEYSGIENVNPLDANNTTVTSGTSTSGSTGSVTTKNANDLILGAVSASETSGSLTTGAWGSFSPQETSQVDKYSVTVHKSTTTTYLATSSAQLIASATGSYSSTLALTPSSSWVGQVAAFKIAPSVTFGADIVNGSGVSISNPTVAMSPTSAGFGCQNSTGTLATSTQQIRVTNTTPADNAGWTLAIGASTANWTNGTKTYAYNNSAGSPAGCTSGQLTINPTTATITPESSPEYGCTNTGITAYTSSTAFTGSTQATLASATSAANYYCYWDITGIGLSQEIPGSQAPGSYSIGLTITLTAL